MVDAIGTQLALVNAPVLSALPVGNTPPVVVPNPVPVQPNVTDQVDIPLQAVQSQSTQPKVEYANPEVLGTEAVTTYMVNGQIYTRYRDELTNKITYIPNEAQVLPGSGSDSATQPVFDITA